MHSNPEALKAIIKAEGNADKIYFAGDFVDYGPDPAGAIKLARELGIQAVSGNHDRRVLRVFESDEYLNSHTTGRMDSVYGPVDVNAPNIRWVDLNCGRAKEIACQAGLSCVSTDDLDFLRTLPRTLSFTADGIAYLMSHQYDDGYGTIQTRYHFDKFWEEHFDLPECKDMPRRMIFGHTHRQLTVKIDGDRLWMNPGSVSYRRPDDPSKDAFYIMITDGVIEMKHVPYERSALYDAVLRVKPMLHPDELRVAEFFFGKNEADGPDHEWLEFLDGIVAARKNEIKKRQ